MSEPVVIVGAGPAGLSCARSYRERGGQLPVVILGADPDPPYERPPLTKEYLRGEIEREELAMESPQFYGDRGIELRPGTAVSSLDPERRRVETAAGESLDYGSCVLACGSRPVLPAIPGIDLPGVLTVRRISDSERLRERLSRGHRLLVVGSGFIGCEAAISAAAHGAEVTVATMEASPQDARLGPEVAAQLAGWLANAGVELITEAELSSIGERGEALLADLGGREVEADTILLALGVVRNSELAGEAGIEREGDLIPVDEQMRTEADGLFAVGDIALALNAAAGRRLAVEHWGEALRHGEVAGAVLAGGDEEWANAPGFWSGLGNRTIKQVAWGDGFDRVELTEHGNGGFTARYGEGGELVGVLTHDADEDYERGRELVEARSAWG